jgi:hypothetical protein
MDVMTIFTSIFSGTSVYGGNVCRNADHGGLNSSTVSSHLSSKDHGCKKVTPHYAEVPLNMEAWRIISCPFFVSLV